MHNNHDENSSPSPNSILAQEQNQNNGMFWEVKYAPQGFFMSRTPQPLLAQDSSIKKSMLASTPVNSSHNLENVAQKSSKTDVHNSFVEHSGANNKMAESNVIDQRSENGLTEKQSNSISAQNIGPLKITSSRQIAKMHESVSVDQQSNEGDRRLKGKIQRLQAHIRHLDERQKKLQTHDAHMEEVLQKVQLKTQLLPRIYDIPRTIEMKQKHSNTYRLNSKLVSLTIDNHSVKPQRKRSVDSDRQGLKKEIVELKGLINNLNEEHKAMQHHLLPKKEHCSGSHELNSIQDDKNSKNMEIKHKNLQSASSPFPSKELSNKVDPKINGRAIINDMKTVFYNGQLQMQGTAPKIISISNDQQQLSEIDLHGDIFVPLNTHSRTSHTLNNTKTKSKASTNNVSNKKEELPKQYVSTLTPYGTQHDTYRKMEHNNRDNTQLRIDQHRKIKMNTFNPEELDNERLIANRKSVPINPIVLKIPPTYESELQKPNTKNRQSKEKQSDLIDFSGPSISKIDVLNNAQDQINLQDQYVQNNLGEISTIELAQFRLSEDLNKKLIVFPKLPGSINALMNLEELTNLAKETFAVFGHPIAEQSSLTIKKYRNCVYFGHHKKNILWHYSGKFYIGGWDGSSKEEGCKNGRGLELIPGNYIYQGEFNNGKREGFGVVNSAKGDNYVGHWYQGLRHGNGRLEEATGIIYDGQWKHGKKDGLGRLIFNGMEVYQGGFEDGFKQGFGKEQYRNKDSYKGEYIMGRFSGEGTYKWANGAVYQGQFLNGMRHGHGIWRSNKQGRGDTYEGQYLQDKKSGLGKYTWQNGTVYKGKFLNDMKHGEGELRYPDGTLIQGIWQQGNLKLETYNSKNQPVREKPKNHFHEEPTRAVQFSSNFHF